MKKQNKVKITYTEELAIYKLIAKESPKDSKGRPVITYGLRKITKAHFDK